MDEATVEPVPLALAGGVTAPASASAATLLADSGLA
jgi:hypothetical protein